MIIIDPTKVKVTLGLNKKTYTLVQQDEKLGNVFDSLPFGIINKTETGMGATTLELNAKRNSIIVEPVKITASSKAFNHSKNGSMVLYVGTPTKYHQDKITDADILDYINNVSIPFKKITVVADSLYRVIKAIGNKNLQDYFLMIDEADSFQIDSTYRKSMEDCIDLYKEFPKDKRCLLSATLLEFSDEELQDEYISTFEYQKPKSRTIELIQSGPGSLLGNAIDKVNDLISSYPQDKIMIAYNSVDGCFDLAEKLRKTKIISENEISILCSKGSSNKVGPYYKELDSDILPTRINFITSAYFTGFDLHERYHLISMSGNKSRFHALSDKRLKQIAGRCRSIDGLLSETIIHDIVSSKTQLKNYTKEELIEVAETEIRALKCLDHQFKSNPLLKLIHEDVNNLILSSLEKKDSRFVRFNDGNYKISYLNIDASLHTAQIAKDLYTNWNALSLELKSAGHKINSKYSESTTKITKQNASKVQRSLQIKEAVKLLRKVTTRSDINEILDETELTSVQRSTIKDYGRLFGFIENNFLLDEIESYADKTTKELNRFINSAHFSVASPTSLFKSRFLLRFPIGGVFTATEILAKINMILAEQNKNLSEMTDIIAVQQLNILLKISKNKRTTKFTIKAENPFSLPIIKYNPDVDEKSFFTFLARSF